MAQIRLDELAIREILDDPGGEVALWLEELASRAAGVARSTVRGRTGETLSSIATEMHYGPDYLSSEVHANYAVFFLEKGTKRHTIRAHGKYSLAHDKLDYFGPVVDHPGQPPHPFLTTGLWSLAELAAAAGAPGAQYAPGTGRVDLAPPAGHDAAGAGCQPGSWSCSML